MDSNDKKPVEAAMLARSMQEAANKFQDRRGELVSIHRVIEAVRRVDRPAYDPAIVSIGPFHRHKRGLAVTVDVKWQYLRHLLARSPENSLQVAVAEVAARVEDIRGSYSEKFPRITDEALVTMMVLDGCFVLELMIKYAINDKNLIYSTGWWAFPRLQNDLILMENQIPFFVLEILFEAMTPWSPDSTTNDETIEEGIAGPDPSRGKAFLHLFRFFYCSQVPQQSTSGIEEGMAGSPAVPDPAGPDPPRGKAFPLGIEEGIAGPDPPRGKGGIPDPAVPDPAGPDPPRGKGGIPDLAVPDPAGPDPPRGKGGIPDPAGPDPAVPDPPRGKGSPAKAFPLGIEEGIAGSPAVPDPAGPDPPRGKAFLHLLHFFYCSQVPQQSTREVPSSSSTPQKAFLCLLHSFYCSEEPQQSTWEVPSSSCWRLQAACNVLRRMRKGVSKAAFQICFVLFSLIVSVLTCDSQGYSPRDDPETPWVIPSATQLQEAGVRFRRKRSDRKKEQDSLVYMEFSAADGFFEIPSMALHGGSNSELRNLVAFEQCSYFNSTLGEYFENEYFSNCCLLMAYLIDTDRDVEILEKEGILVNLLGSRSEVAALFDNIIKGSRLEANNAYFKKLTEDVKKYCKSERHRWRARLMRDYFGTPWAIISVVAAVVLLGLTIVQTFYTVSAYYHPR